MKEAVLYAAAAGVAGLLFFFRRKETAQEPRPRSRKHRALAQQERTISQSASPRSQAAALRATTELRGQAHQQTNSDFHAVIPPLHIKPAAVADATAATAKAIITATTFPPLPACWAMRLRVLITQSKGLLTPRHLGFTAMGWRPLTE